MSVRGAGRKVDREDEGGGGPGIVRGGKPRLLATASGDGVLPGAPGLGDGPEDTSSISGQGASGGGPGRAD